MAINVSTLMAVFIYFTMVQIKLFNVGKQYNNDWIFSGLSCQFSPVEHTVILGANGSGKSTILQLLLSSITPTIGNISFIQDGLLINNQSAFRLISICAPYIELIEEFTMEEMINFHRRLKPLTRNISSREFTAICQLENSYKKLIHNFSSGMKQRIKLALAILSDTPVLLLDEPTTNLDQKGIEWYKELIEQYQANRTIVVSSNSIVHEYGFCSKRIVMEDFKTKPVTDPSLLLF